MPRIQYKGVAAPPAGFDIRRCHVGIVGYSRVNFGDIVDVSDAQAAELLTETEHVFVLADEQKPMKAKPVKRKQQKKGRVAK